MRVTPSRRISFLSLTAAMALSALSSCTPGTEPPDETDPNNPVATTAFGVRQLRLLTRAEYDATVRDLLFAEPMANNPQECAVLGDCNAATESCVGGACVADPCNLVTFTLPASANQYTSVVVSGSFNGWASTATAGAWPMTWEPSVGAWVAKHEVTNGDYSYKFVIDGATWLADPSNPSTEPDGFGGFNSLLHLACTGSEPPPPTTDTSASFSADFPVETRPEKYPFDNSAEAGLVTSVHAEQYHRAARRIAELALADVPGLIGCDPTSTSDPCIATFVEQFGRRAYRRSLDDAEVQRALALITSQPTVRDGLEVWLRVVLESPWFLYRSEIGKELTPGTYQLEPWEVATLLSYAYIGTTPDDALLDAAEGGDLETPADYEREARRLLADPRARDQIGRFTMMWLGVERIIGIDKGVRDDFDQDLAQEMATETQRFVEGVFFDSHRFEDLFVGDHTLAEPRLATWYGADAGGLLPESRRAGILASGSILASYSHSNQSSPVRRGVFVRTRLMCMELGTPPPNGGSVPDVDPNATTRERFEQHMADPFCASCHRNIDPIGFGFEHFDEVGAWRDTDNGSAIDATGQLTYSEGWKNGESPLPFSTLPELGGLLASSGQVRRCFVQQLQRFTTGRLETADDDPTVAALMDRFDESEHDPLELLVSLTQVNAFAVRK
ncbi:MAG: DUF1588 domain-containing protein [Polyangiaceae bacterium]